MGQGRVRGANDRVRVGFIGVGNRGDQVLDAFLPHKDAEIVAICDIYQPRELGRVARPRTEAGVQQEPHVLPVSLVLRLLGRPAHQLRRDNREVPDTLEVLWTYPGGTLVTFSQYNATAAPAARDRRIEIEFRGTKGTLYLFSDGYEIVPDEITQNEFPARTPVDRQSERGYRTGAKPLIEAVKRTGGSTDTAAHARNFLDCVRSRDACNCDIETGHRGTSATLLGNVAHKTKSYLEWDRAAERVTNHAQANALLSYRYRPPYTFPA